MARAAAAAVAIAAIVAGCGGHGSAQTGHRAAGASHTPRSPPSPVAGASGHRLPLIAGVRQRLVGSGARAAVILSAARPKAHAPTVIFLHHWTASVPAYYSAWMQHLTSRTSAVIFPVYQNAGTTPGAALANALAGIQMALTALGRPLHPTVVVGLTTGGVLAVDYAATARADGLPEATAVLAVYPGGNPSTGLIPRADPSRIPRSTRIEAIAGPGDPVVGGTMTAHAIVSAPRHVPPDRRRYLTAPDPSPAGPFEHDRLAVRSFWAPLDRLLALAAPTRGSA